MPRTRRMAPDNCVHHVLNRRNRKEILFSKNADYEAFVMLLADAIDRVPMRVLDWCLMPTHWHIALWPKRGVELSAFIGWLSNAHVRQHHHRHRTTGQGHIYQGRFKNFIVQRDAHLYRVLRYIEANPLRAGLVERAELWPWSSLGCARTPDGLQICSEWPVPRPSDWIAYVNQGIPQQELAALQHSARRGTPFGDDYWVADTAIRYGLESTVHMPGRPRKKGTATFSPFE
jgi:putative transposase